MSLLVYDICPVTVEAIEAKINMFIEQIVRATPGPYGYGTALSQSNVETPIKIHLARVHKNNARLLFISKDSGDPVIKADEFEEACDKNQYKMKNRRSRIPS